MSVVKWVFIYAFRSLFSLSGVDNHSEGVIDLLCIALDAGLRSVCIAGEHSFFTKHIGVVL